jgi:hypothetical protein
LDRTIENREALSLPSQSGMSVKLLPKAKESGNRWRFEQKI